MTPQETVSPKDFTAKMGDDLGTIYFHLWNDIIGLNNRWDIYSLLFRKSDKRIALLNETADLFFKTLWHSLFEDVVLQLARLTDPPRTGKHKNGQENLTVKLLPDLVLEEFKAEVELLVRDVIDKASFARAWRNKALAHSDLKHKIDPDANPLPGITYSQVDKALESLSELMNGIDLHYNRSESRYKLIESETTVESLITYLHKGWKEEQALQERINSGNWRPEDLNFTDDI